MTIGTTPRTCRPFDGGLAAHLDAHCIWIVSPDGYSHARAFDEVAVALSAGLVELGGSAPVVRSPHDFGGRSPIVLGANLLDLASATVLPDDAVLFNLEQVDRSSDWFTGDYLELLSRYAVLDYSARNRDALALLGIAHARVLELGHAAALSRFTPAVEPDIDVVFYGSMNARRWALLDEIEQRGLSVERLFDVYGAERDAAIARARMVVNAHYYDSSVFEIVRVSHLLANGVTVVTEGSLDDPDLAPFADGMVISPFEELADRCVELAADPDRCRRIGEAGHALFASRPQSECWRRLFDEPMAADAPSVVRVTAPGGPPQVDAPLGDVRSATVVCPAVVSDVARSLHQLAEAMNALGVATEIAYVGWGNDIERTGLHLRCAPDPSNECLTAYAAHEPRLCGEVFYSPDHLVIVPDLLAPQAAAFTPFRTAVWWLSTDQTDIGDLVADPGMVHFHRCAQVRELLASNGAHSLPLTDITIASIEAGEVGERDAAIAYSPAGHPGAQRLASAHPELRARPLPAEDSARVAEVAARTCVYVEFGPRAGRDHALRAAAAAGAVVFVRSDPADAVVDAEDLPIPSLYRFTDADVTSGELHRRIVQTLSAPAAAWRSQSWFRQLVRHEANTMRTQLHLLFGRP
ncbi:MAG: glycosyltransferase family 1 protein [Acidimicrobiales bacterium]|nr:glycosyltransferase family 1 protein [Acidimicrobiales bacterium]